MKYLFNVIIVLLIMALTITTVGATKEHTEDERIHQVESKRLQVQQKKIAIVEQSSQSPEAKQQEIATLLTMMQTKLPSPPPLTTISGLPGFLGSQAGRVLVIPEEELNIEQMVRIAEDMTVMSRILDKKIYPDLRTGILYGGRGGYGGYLSGQFFGGAGTKGIYLENYGAIFVAKVDFPLVRPVDSNEPNKVDDTEDKLWRETKMELYDPEKSHRYVEMHKEHQSGPAYDSEKVEALKNELIKALKHATNIRDLNANSQRVIITVIGGGRSTVHTFGGSGYGGRGGGYGSRNSGYGGRGGYGGGHTVEVPTTFGARSVLTVWAWKADIDRFAKGQIDFEEFRSKVRVLMY